MLDDSRKPFYRWFTGGELNTCYNALDRHVENGRAEQTALIYDSPVTRMSVRSLSFASFVMRSRRALVLSRRSASRKGDRVVIYMPMIPEAVIAMLAVARLGAIHSVVFGGFAANELAVRIDDATPKVVHLGVVRHRARACRIVQATARPRDRAGQAQARAVRHLSASDGARGARFGAATSTGTRPWRRQAARVRAGRGDRPALHPLHVGHDRPTERHRPRQRRTSRRAQLDDEERLRGRTQARCTGLRPTSAGWSATRTSSTRRSSTATRRCCSRASPSARPTPACSGGSSRSTTWPVCSPRRRPSARSSARIRTASVHRQIRSIELPHAVPRRRATRPRHASVGGERAPRARHRSLVADRDRLADLRQLPRTGNAPGQAGLRHASRCQAGTCACSTAAARPARAGDIGALVCPLPLPPGTLPRCGTPMRATRRHTSRSSRVTTRQATLDSWTRTATSS